MRFECVATEKLSTRFCVKVVSSEAIIMVLFSSSYFNASPVQSFLIRDFCSRHMCAEGKKGQYMLRLPEVVGAKRQMLVATYNDVYAKKNYFKTPEPFETAVEFSSSLPYFPFRRPFWLLPPYCFSMRNAPNFFPGTIVSVSNYNNCWLAPFRSSLQCAFETS